MKKIITLSMLTISTFMFSQTDYSKIKLNKDEQKLKEAIKKSFYFSQFPELDLNFYAIKYNCLEKKYDIDAKKSKEFLSKKDFFKAFPNWTLEDDRFIEYTSTLQESMKFEHFNSFKKKHDIFPKCIKEPYQGF